MTDRLLISGGTVLSMDPTIGDLPSGDIFIEDGRIVEVAAHIDADGATRVDATNRIVIPGFVDTHRHTWQSALRHRCGDLDFEGYRCEMLSGLGPKYEPEDIYIGNLLGATAALDAGTTTMLDWSHALNTPEHADAAIQALRESGIRGLFAQGWSRADGQNWTRNSELRHNPDIIRVRREVLSSDDALVTHYMAARGPEMTTDEVVVQDFALARELGLRLSMHVGVGAMGGLFTGIETMARLGVLGTDLTLIHLCASSPNEMRLMAEHGVSACIGPQAEMMPGGGGVPALGRLLAAGVKPSLSGDTETVGSGDLFTQMRLAIAAERLLTNNRLIPDAVPEVKVRDMLEFATIVGAEACGLAHRVGSLTPGKDADVVLVRADDLNLAPVSDPVGALVLAAHAGNVDTVLVRGEFRKRDGKMIGVDLDRLQRQGRASRDALLARR